MNYWMMKSEPTTFGIDDLAKLPRKTDGWEGVRNYQARNMMRDDMQVGDLAFFYHSNCTPPGVVGIMKIVKAAYPDITALNPNSKYFDPKATDDNPRWVRVDVQFIEKFDRLISISELRENPKLKTLRILEKGSRLSITPVTAKEWDAILKMA